MSSLQAEGGEGVLLDDFANMGIRCDPATQLVITCEVCRRPSNRECWTCGMKICEFCTLKRHWKVSKLSCTHLQLTRVMEHEPQLYLQAYRMVFHCTGH